MPGFHHRRAERAKRAERSGRVDRRNGAAARPEQGRRADAGFTLIELTVAMGLAAFVFAAVAATMMGGLRSLAVAKARTQGNEVATQAIEDLQRFGYEKLGHCTEPSNKPAGLTDWVQLTSGCPTATVEDSCTNQAGSAISSLYSCTRNSISYEVSRYIAWANPEQTAKRLAVFVRWRDQVGWHTVSQQSSVRAPSLANVIGLSPPVLTSGAVASSSMTIDDTGKLTSSATISVTAQGVDTTDTVMAVLSVLDPYGNPTQDSFPLNALTASSWSGVLSSAQGFRFGPGTQYVTITAIRAKDGKQTSTVASPTLTISCPSPCTTPPSPPSLSNPTAPSSVGLYTGGAIKSDVTITVDTKNVTLDDRVTVGFMTQTGMSTLTMSPDPSAPCTKDGCRWKTVITSTSGYAFNSGNQKFYFTAQQVKSPDPTSVDQGSTNAISGPAAGVTFQ